MKATLFETPPAEANRWNSSVTEYHKDKAKKRAASDVQNHLELSLGIPSNNSSNVTDMTTTPDVLILGRRKLNVDPASAKASFVSAAISPGVEGCFIDSHVAPSTFIHPWSLAARQQKAAYEKAYKKPKSPPPPPSMPRFTHIPVLPLVVGWPPIRTFRKNLLFKSTMARVNGANLVMAENQGANAPGNPMFVKVHMQGFSVGRKINLSLHHDYDTFFHSMQKLFRNFLDAHPDDIGAELDVDDDIYDEFLVLYEDHEGDHILVGDIPWGHFMASARRLFIVPNPKARTNAFDGAGN